MDSGPYPPRQIHVVTLPDTMQITPVLLAGGPKCLLQKIGPWPSACGAQSDIWKGQITEEGGGEPILVAVKCFRPWSDGSQRDSAQQVKTFNNEVRVWVRLKHEFVATFYGVVNSEVNPAIVLSWYKNGNANEYLRGVQDIQLLPIIFILQLASALEYLHNKGIIHGDVKAANMMIDDYGNVKLIDFGSSRLVGDDNVATNACTVRWAAAELLQSGISTTATDVYAFASTGLELLTGNSPYDMLRESAALFAIIKGMKPRDYTNRGHCNIPDSAILWVILDKCWAVEEERLNMSQVLSFLMDPRWAYL
ncbi:kinase-like domain-containing protein [Hysterangium stoloniferum]|nr:kinase-like domain-containing protein [Hysterangium stoloniferum]